MPVTKTMQTIQTSLINSNDAYKTDKAESTDNAKIIDNANNKRRSNDNRQCREYRKCRRWAVSQFLRCFGGKSGDYCHFRDGIELILFSEWSIL